MRRKAFIFNTFAADEKMKKRTAKYGEYYNNIDFEINQDLTLRDISNPKSRNNAIGWLHIDGVRLPFNTKALANLKYLLQEELLILKKFKHQKRIVEIRHLSLNLTSPELHRLLELLEDVFYTHHQRIHFGFTE